MAVRYRFLAVQGGPLHFHEPGGHLPRQPQPMACSTPQVFAIQSGAADKPVRQAARYGFTDMPMALVEKLFRLEFGESTEGLTKS